MTDKPKPEKKKKVRFSTIVFLLLLAVGLGVLLYPTVSDTYSRWKAVQSISQYNVVAAGTDKDYSELWEAAEEYNRRLAESGNFTVFADDELENEISQYLNPLGTGMMGYIDIPAIDVYIPIYQGTDESALQAGAGYWIGTSLPTGGESTHCVLTAHNGLVKAKMFTDLDKLELGDTFTLTVLDRVLTYEVDQILTVEPDDFSELTIVEGEDYVTLYTCTPYGVNTHRLLVRGHRIETPQEELESKTEPQLRETEINLILQIVLPLLLILLLAALIVLREKKRYHGQHEKRRDRK
ncbi:MAG: class C sortase [Oscillospiraceae bacterium]|nr:class C sortase [Oscillospiraceae bacterium]